MKPLGRTAIYEMVRNGRYNDAAFMLLEAAESSRTNEKIQSTKDAFRVLQKYGCKRKEHFVVLLLDGSHHVIKVEVVTVGLANRTLIHPREIFYPAILNNATAVILSHNHPSGSVDPSPEDLEITERIKSTGEILGIEVLDHIVVSSVMYYSFMEHGLFSRF